MDFNTRYYLTESVQQILKSIGTNCIINGLNVLSSTIDDDNVINIELASGKLICDSTLIEFPTNFDISFNVDTLNDNGFVVIVVSFRYLRTSRPNQSIVALKYVDENNQCENWFKERDKVVLAKIEFNKDSKTITPVVSSFLDKEVVTINNDEYEISPFNETVKQLRPLLKQLSLS
jgi:hypothetical protein